MVRARGAGGPDKPGAQGYVGGPALDAERSCVTLGVMDRRIRRLVRHSGTISGWTIKVSRARPVS